MNIVKFLTKILIYILGFVVVLVVGVGVYLKLFFDPNAYKPIIEQQVFEHTGRKLQLPGEITLSLYPWIGLELGEIKLDNAAGFGDTPFASMKRVEVKVKLLPLLSKKIEVEAVLVDQLSLSLGKNKAGKTNWDDLSKSSATTPQGSETQPTNVDAQVQDQKPSEGIDPALITGFRLGGFDIKNATIVWDDQLAGQHIQLHQFNLALGEIIIGQAISFSLNFMVNDISLAMKHNFQLSGIFKTNVAFKQFDIDRLILNLQSTGKALPKSPLNINMKSDMAIDLEKQQFNTKQFSLGLLDRIALSGDVKMTQLFSAPIINAAMKSNTINLKALLNELKIVLPEMADANALTKLSLALSVNTDLNNLNVTQLDVQLDDIEIKGNAQVKHFANPEIMFAVDVNSIDVDRYLPPPAEGESTKTTVPSSEPQPEPEKNQEPPPETPLPIPVELIRGLNIDGQLKIGFLKVMNVKSDGVMVDVKAQGGEVKTKQQIDKFYQGQYAGTADIDVRGAIPLFKVTENMQKVNIGPLLTDITKEQLISGVAVIKVDITTKGHLISVIKKNLNGDVSFNFADGALEGINVSHKIKALKAKLSGQPEPPPPTENKTRFTEFLGDSDIKNGVVTNKNLEVGAPYMQANGHGVIDLVKEMIDYTANVSITKSKDITENKLTSDLEGVFLPIYIKGNLMAPDIKVDYQAVVKALTSKRIDNEKAKLKKKLAQKKAAQKKKLQDKIKQKLKLNDLGGGNDAVKQKLKEKEDKIKQKFKKLFKF